MEGPEGGPLGPWSCPCHTTPARCSSSFSKDRILGVCVCVGVYVRVNFRPAHRGFLLQQEAGCAGLAGGSCWHASWAISAPRVAGRSELCPTQQDG